MRASEWQFLCAVHETPKSCCAIDYCCHTLDWAANVVTDQKIFPSRFMVQNDAHNKNMGLRNLVNVFRRLHRIFAHAWFQHRSVFWAVEGQSGLYIFFKAVCDTYDLLPAENYKLPPEAEGLEAPSAETEAELQPPPVILERQSAEQDQSQQGPVGQHQFNFEDANIPPPSRTNTRRHIRASPSTGSAVTTVMETEEEEGDGVSKKMRELQLSAPETVEEEPDSADVPVIVDRSAINDTPTTAEPQTSEVELEDDVSEADQTVVEVGDETDAKELATPDVNEPEAGESSDMTAPTEAAMTQTTPGDATLASEGDAEDVSATKLDPAVEPDATESESTEKEKEVV
jgi:hypothetical protein